MSEEKQPTKEEILEFLNESIEISKLRAELQDHNTRIAVGRAEELKALAFIANLTNPKGDEQVTHTVTEEDVELNPQLSEMGISVGDEVMIPKEQARKLKRKTEE
jgi:hypothetical protein